MATNLTGALLSLKVGVLDNGVNTDADIQQIEGILIIARLLRSETAYINSYLYAGAQFLSGDDLIGIIKNSTLTAAQKNQLRNFVVERDLDLTS